MNIILLSMVQRINKHISNVDSDAIVTDCYFKKAGFLDLKSAWQ